MEWIPERIGLKEGFQREKEWKRMKEAWHQGNVMVSLGTGSKVSEGLVKLHAYGVIRECTLFAFFCWLIVKKVYEKKDMSEH